MVSLPSIELISFHILSTKCSHCNNFISDEDDRGINTQTSSLNTENEEFPTAAGDLNENVQNNTQDADFEAALAYTSKSKSYTQTLHPFHIKFTYNNYFIHTTNQLQVMKINFKILLLICHLLSTCQREEKGFRIQFTMTVTKLTKFVKRIFLLICL